MPGAPHILHVFSTFDPGGPQVRTCAILNALGPRFRHTITATDGSFTAAGRLAPELACEILPPPPGKGSVSYPLAFRKLLRQLRPDLLLTYNWGAFDAALGGVLARTCPVIHAEDGFGADEAVRLKTRRVWSRRLLFPHLERLVVPSRTLLRIASSRYGMKPDRVDYIPNGVDLGRFRPGRNTELRRRWGVTETACLFGFVGRLGSEKNVAMLLRAFAQLPGPDVGLAIVGDGPCRRELEELNRHLGGRAVFAGAVADPAPCYAALDVFALPSDTEQMPVALLEAMASGLPAVVTAVGDSAGILSGQAFPSVVPPRDPGRFHDAMLAMCQDARLRARLGAANRTRVEEQYSFDAMVRCYEALYRGAVRQARC